MNVNDISYGHLRSLLCGPETLQLTSTSNWWYEQDTIATQSDTFDSPTCMHSYNLIHCQSQFALYVPRQAQWSLFQSPTKNKCIHISISRGGSNKEQWRRLILTPKMYCVSWLWLVESTHLWKIWHHCNIPWSLWCSSPSDPSMSHT
jgi:hypothetical protein